MIGDTEILKIISEGSEFTLNNLSFYLTELWLDAKESVMWTSVIICMWMSLHDQSEQVQIFVSTICANVVFQHVWADINHYSSSEKELNSVFRRMCQGVFLFQYMKDSSLEWFPAHWIALHGQTVAQL